MAANSSIEWTEATWNPLAGCSEVSPGCTHCYAAVMAKRLEAMGQGKYSGTTRTLDNGKVVWTGKIALDEKALQIPLKRKKPTMYFVNSMSDLFHENVPDEFICRVLGIMSLCGQHTFQVLTKRDERMAAFFAADENSLSNCQARTATGLNRVRDTSAINGTHGAKVGDGNYWPLPNVWLGVSVEDQARADERIPQLLKTPAYVRFLSCEPLLGPLDLFNVDGSVSRRMSELNPRETRYPAEGIDWVIVGGESGHGARPLNVAWVRSIVEQCKQAQVACFVKQLGEHVVCRNDEIADWFDQCTHLDMRGNPEFQGQVERVVGFHHRKGGDPAEWPMDLRVRQFPS